MEIACLEMNSYHNQTTKVMPAEPVKPAAAVTINPVVPPKPTVSVTTKPEPAPVPAYTVPKPPDTGKVVTLPGHTEVPSLHNPVLTSTIDKEARKTLLLEQIAQFKLDYIALHSGKIGLNPHNWIRDNVTLLEDRVKLEDGDLTGEVNKLCPKDAKSAPLPEVKTVGSKPYKSPEETLKADKERVAKDLAAAKNPPKR